MQKYVSVMHKNILKKIVIMLWYKNQNNESGAENKYEILNLLEPEEPVLPGYYMKSRQGRNPDRERRTPEKIQKQGLTLTLKMWDKTEENIHIPATDILCRKHPDVIFVCVKGYSLHETIPFIKRIARKILSCNSSVEYIWNRWKNAERIADLR